MNSLIKAIERNTAKRKKIKNRIDSVINLSAGNEQNAEFTAMLSARKGGTNRLIDEGAIIEGDGSTWGYIEKGTLEKYLNGENIYLDNLPEDFVGYVNIGHFDHTIFPFPVGEWRKSDMTLIDIGDGRHGIDMNNSTIDRDSVFIKELERLGLDVSESIEATFHLDFEASEDLGFPVFDEILIYGYSIVGDGKNVGSNGLQLKGETNMLKDKENLTAETANIEIELNGAEEVIEEVTEIEEQIEEVAEEVTEDAAEEINEEDNAEEEPSDEVVELSAEDADEEVATDEPEEDTESDEEDVVEEVEADAEADDDEDEIEEADHGLDEVLSVVNELKAQIAELSNTVAELRKKNRRLSNKLAVEKEKKADFLAKTKELSVELLPNELAEEQAKAEEIARLEAEKQYKYGDGIADI